LTRVQLLANAIEVGTPAVSDDGVATMELDAGDHDGVGPKDERRFAT
jgi:hypothetical protein